MKKIKVVTLFCLLLFLTFLYLDNISYYYGFGKGFLSSKLPSYIRPHYRGTDLGNTGFVFVEKDINLDIIDNLNPVYLLNNRRIMIKKFLGYYYDEKMVTVKIVDSFNQIRYIKIQRSISNKKQKNLVFEEITSVKKTKYIDLNRDLNYFQKIKMLKNLVLIILSFLLLYLLKLLFKKRKIEKSI